MFTSDAKDRSKDYDEISGKASIVPSVAILGTRGYPSYYGGFETAVRQLAPYLADNGWDVTVYGRKGATQSDDRNIDPRVKRVETWSVNRKSLSTLSHGLTATLHLLFHRTDVALIMNVANGFYIPLLRVFGIPVVINVDGMEWKREKWNCFARAVFVAGARLSARFSDRIIVDSREIGRLWKEQFDVDGTFIPYGGFDADTLELKDDFDPGGYVLYVARFVPENSFAVFLRAAEKLCESYDVVLVGSSGYDNDFDEMAKKAAETYPKIHWLGSIRDDDRLFALWQNAGVYFHGHSVGGTNPALVQAMMCGAPIVARRTAFNSEVLAGTGVLVDPTATEVTAAIVGLMEDASARKRLSAEAKSRARMLYSWGQVCRDYESTLITVMR